MIKIIALTVFQFINRYIFDGYANTIEISIV